MRLLLLACNGVDSATSSAVLGGLAPAYEAAGHRVIAAGQAEPGSRRPAREKTPWGELLRLGGRSRDSLVRGDQTALELLALLGRVDFVHLHFPGLWNRSMTAIWTACELRGKAVGAT